MSQALPQMATDDFEHAGQLMAYRLGWHPEHVVAGRGEHLVAALIRAPTPVPSAIHHYGVA